MRERRLWEGWRQPFVRHTVWAYHGNTRLGNVCFAIISGKADYLYYEIGDNGM